MIIHNDQLLNIFSTEKPGRHQVKTAYSDPNKCDREGLLVVWAVVDIVDRLHWILCLRGHYTR